MEAHWFWLFGVAAVVLLVALLAWVWFRTLDSETKALAGRIGRLSWRAKGGLAWALFRDRRVPLWVRAIVPALALYLALPFDVIPDVIPVLGYLDDVAIVLFAGGALVRFMPRAVLEEHLARLETAARDQRGA